MSKEVDFRHVLKKLSNFALASYSVNQVVNLFEGRLSYDKHFEPSIRKYIKYM